MYFNLFFVWFYEVDTLIVTQEFMTNRFVDADIINWSVTGPLNPSSLIYDCNGQLLFGGY